MSSIILPLEIEAKILDLLIEDHEGHLALETCSLVCKAFLPICRKHLFRTIVLLDAHIIHPFERLLRETPKIADYIRNLDYKIRTADLSSPSIQETLKRISRLESLTLLQSKSAKFDWSDNPIRPALIHLLHLPTLRHFKMTNIDNFLVSDLMPCVNLKYLEIGVHTSMADENIFPADFPEHSIQLKEFVAGTSDSTMKLCTARRPDGQPVIDFGSLSEIKANLEEPDDEASRELFKRCHALTTAHIYCWNLENIRPNIADMLRPSMQSLKHFAVIIGVDDADDNDRPLFGIPSELEVMRTKNIIETVTILIMLQTDSDANFYWGDEWVRLDEVLTSPGWFSLKRVLLSIDVERDGEVLEMALQTLPVMQFPRLKSSNSVSFDFKVNTLH